MIIVRIFDYASIAALAFMSYGVFSQWRHVHKFKSAKDIVTREVIIRFVVTLVLLIKIFLVGDIFLIIGQLIFAVVISIYTFSLLKIKYEKI